MPRIHTFDPRAAVGGAKFSDGETVEVVVRISTTLFANHVNPIAGSKIDSPAMNTATVPSAA